MGTLPDELTELLRHCGERERWATLLQQMQELDRCRRQLSDLPGVLKSQPAELHYQWDTYREDLERERQAWSDAVWKFLEKVFRVTTLVDDISPVLAAKLPDVRNGNGIQFINPDAAAQAVREVHAAIRERLATLPAGPAGVQPATSAEPAKVLFGWPEILAVLFKGEKNLTQRKNLVAKLNREKSGPIKTEGQGSRPYVVKSQLVAWWDRMFVQADICVKKSESREETPKIQYDYERTGTVATELGGSVKARRASKRRATS